MEEGDLYRAVTEYKRFVAMFPSDPRALDARLEIAKVYERGEHHGLAVAAYLAAAEVAGEREADARLAAALAAYHGFDYERAEELFLDFAARFPDDPRRDLALYRAAWCRVGLEDFRGAEARLRPVARAEGRLARPARELALRLARVDDLPHRSPVVAGVLAAVLPGAGHFYSQDWANGVLALVVNGLFAFGTYEAVENETYTAAGLMGLFGFGFYLGNVFGAVNASHKFNRAARAAFLGDLVRELEQPGTAGGR